jgi:hypothetical protein
MESLDVPPVKRVSSEDISGAMHFHLAPEGYRYEPQTIENADGSPITIKDFVIQVHNHLSQHRDVIFNYRKAAGFNSQPPTGASIDPSSPPSYYTAGYHALVFKSGLSSAFSDPLMIDVSTFMEGERGISAYSFWVSQRRAAALSELLRTTNLSGLQSSE